MSKAKDSKTDKVEEKEVPEKSDDEAILTVEGDIEEAIAENVTDFVDGVGAPKQVRRAAGLFSEYAKDLHQPNGVLVVEVKDGKVALVSVIGIDVATVPLGSGSSVFDPASAK